MLLQLKVFTFPAFAPRKNHAASGPVLCSGGARRRTALLVGALLLGALGGCKFDDNHDTYTDSMVYKKLHPIEVKPLDTGDAISLPSGGGGSHAVKSLPPAPSAANALLQDDPFGHPTEGERTVGWTGVYDVYWKLNWARKELLTGNVPHDLAEVIISTRKHCKRLANEFPKLQGMDERLDAANSALDHLENGLQQMNDLAALEDRVCNGGPCPGGRA